MSTHAHVLGYDAAPPLVAPLRYFLTAPLFGLAAGLMLLLQPDLLSSRWTPGALAVTHLVTVGFMLMVMVGALFQILPVVAGAVLPRANTLAAVVHVALASGAVALAWGLGAMSPTLLTWAAGLLGGGFGLFLLAAAWALWQAPIAQPTPRDLRLALIGLGVAATLGLSLAMILSRGLPLPLFELLKLHMGWALAGGAGMLLAATSWMVVPMFQITPGYPAAMTRCWSVTMFALLAAWSATVMAAPKLVPTLAPMLELVALAALVLAAALFPVATLRIQARTRRARPDPVFNAFRFGMACLLAGLACSLAASLWDHAFWPLAGGILLLHGGFVSVISGMLYKIVPFLVWLNLNQARIRPPNVKKLLPEAPMQRQLRVHALATLALLAAAFVGHAALTVFAAMLVMLEFALLGLNVLRVARQYGQLVKPS